MSDAFPVFENGVQVDDLAQHNPSGGTTFLSGPPMPLPRNPAREHELAEKHFRAVCRANNPALADAHDLREKREQEFKTWQQRCADLSEVVMTARNRCIVSRSANGQRRDEQREQQLSALEDELREHREELAAAAEELEAARALVNSLLKVTA